MVAKTKEYIPDRGDIVWLNFNPTRGHEQKGKRPALVLSPKIYNKHAELALLAPITSTVKGYPFEVLVSTKVIKGVILADQLRSVDWVERKAQKISSASATTMLAVQEHLEKLLVLTS